jgi:hypothetical protein
MGKKRQGKNWLFAEHLLDVFSPHINDTDQEVEHELATLIQSQKRLKVFTLRELKDVIKTLNQTKAQGHDLITAKMLKELPQGLINLMYIFNVILRLEYWPRSLKFAQMVMRPKPGKTPMDGSSYLLISLLPIISKVLEKLNLKKINKDLNSYDWIPNHQFGFRQAHSRVQQCHRIKYVINKAMENWQYCTSVFLDVSQAFDKGWHPGLLIKIKRLLPLQYYNLLKSYLSECQFETKFNG